MLAFLSVGRINEAFHNIILLYRVNHNWLVKMLMESNLLSSSILVNGLSISFLVINFCLALDVFIVEDTPQSRSKFLAFVVSSIVMNIEEARAGKPLILQAPPEIQLQIAAIGRLANCDSKEALQDLCHSDGNACPTIAFFEDVLASINSLVNDACKA